MRVADFSFELPESLIAHYPMSERSSCRLLSLDGPTGELTHGTFTDLLDKLNPGDLLVFNNTRVIPARTVLDILNAIGHMPLPPYIERPDEEADRELYQTVYSQKPGAVAAPTAGLHFDEPLLEKLRAKGVEMAFVTLHVGAGTFQPVRVDSIEDHIMHSEYAEVPQDVVDAVLAAKARGSRVVAVGTTSVRSLESAAQAAKRNLIEPFFGDTQIFIYPGYQYKVIDALVTNFHLPESTLIMLVSAFAGYQNTMSAYKSAVEQKYRFFSYGDAMFITYNPLALNERVGE